MVKDNLINVSSNIVSAVRKGGRIFVCGNGGLAAESSHFAAELIGTYAFPVYVSCVDLTSNNALITALANDIGFENVFSHQIKYLGHKNDVFIGMTTSKSQNILKALHEAEKIGMTCVILCGKNHNFSSDMVVALSDGDVAEVQEAILKFLHKLAYEIKKELGGGQ